MKSQGRVSVVPLKRQQRTGRLTQGEVQEETDSLNSSYAESLPPRGSPVGVQASWDLRPEAT